MLSTDCSASDILPTAVKSGTVFYYHSGMGFGVLFYYILFFFFLQGFGGEGIWTNTVFSGSSLFPADIHIWPLSVIFDLICHVGACLLCPEGWPVQCMGMSVTVGEAICLVYKFATTVLVRFKNCVYIHFS